ncbi:MAG: hypothetical protein P4L69_21485 [Desulfosporosinus sp.]|nr:hypothetical protein [Desulfosporosinus sp.]
MKHLLKSVKGNLQPVDIEKMLNESKAGHCRLPFPRMVCSQIIAGFRQENNGRYIIAVGGVAHVSFCCQRVREIQLDVNEEIPLRSNHDFPRVSLYQESFNKDNKQPLKVHSMLSEK